MRVRGVLANLTGGMAQARFAPQRDTNLGADRRAVPMAVRGLLMLHKHKQCLLPLRQQAIIHLYISMKRYLIAPP